MRKFIAKLCLLISIVICVDLLLGLVCNFVYANTHKGDYGRNNYISTQVDRECLIFGSSREIHHFSAKIIEERTGLTCYNCGDDGMGIVAMYGRYQLIRQRSKPKVVIYDVVSSFDLACDDKTKYVGNLRLHSENKQIADLIAEIDKTELFKNILRTYKYNSRFIDIIAQYISNSPGDVAEYDYAPLYGVMEYDVESKVGKEIYVDPFKLALFEELITTCKTDGTQLIFTVSPWYKATDDVEYCELLELCRLYSVPVLNYYMDEEFITSKYLFKDSSHLNKEGAIILSNKVCDELISILN